MTHDVDNMRWRHVDTYILVDDDSADESGSNYASTPVE